MKGVGDLKETLVSLAKAMPLIGGALVGFVSGPGGSSVLQDVRKGAYENAVKQMIVNYTFYNPFSRKFELEQGWGIKGLALGLLGYKIIDYIDG